MTNHVSYGKLRPAFVGALGVIFDTLRRRADGHEGARSCTVSEITQFCDSGVWGSEATDPANDMRVFRVSDFKGDFQLNLETAPMRSISEDKKAKWRLERGDLLVVKSSGSAKQVVSGRVAVFPGSNGRAFAASNFLLRLRLRKGFDPDYVAFALGSPATREHIANSVKTMTYPNIAFKMYKDVSIPIIPENEQRAVADFLLAFQYGHNLPLLPSYLHETRRTVAKIERLAARIDEAKELGRRSAAERDQLCRTLLREDREAIPTPMHDLVHWRKPDIEVLATQSYDFAGVYCFGRGLFRSGRKLGAEFAYKRLCQIRTGEFVYPKLMAWEGALAVVPPECDGLFVSPEFPVFQIDETRVLPEVLDVYFRSPSVWPTLSGASTGTNVRRRRLNPADFLSYRFPLPAMRTQLALRRVQNKVHELKRLEADSAEKLDALLPAILDRAFKGEL